MKFTNKIYQPSEVEAMVYSAMMGVKKTTIPGTKYKPKRTIYECACAFDTEASSFYCCGKKVGLVYAWTLGINGYVMMGRSLDEYKEAMSRISDLLNLSEENRLYIYVHNLAYDFQFIRKYHEVVDLFALDTHKPMYAVTKDGFEYRCSYLLTGSSLETVAKNLFYHKIRKLVGDLDYRKIRTPETPLTNKEIGYCVEDVKIVMAAIDEKIQQEGSIVRIPATNTGYVRRYCRDICYNDKNKIKYSKLMSKLTMSLDEYNMCKDAFAGGFTHANWLSSGEVFLDVASYDETSAYPAVMVLEEFPMSKGSLIEPKNIDVLKSYFDRYCVIFEAEFTNISSTQVTDRPLSSSKCSLLKGSELDNGRVIRADVVVTTITNVDFEILEKFYKWDTIRVSRAYVYRKGRLPKCLVEAILDLYKKKTELKGIDEAAIEYALSKGMLNSAYGMTVMDIVRELFEYSNEEWEDPSQVPPEDQIRGYNDSKNRFLFYPWGVFVTAYARRNVLEAVYECKHTNDHGEEESDYIYSDTDSCKIRNWKMHKKFFEDYNRRNLGKIYMASSALQIPVEMFIPKTKKGVEKAIGAFDFEGTYTAFKTLGAKRYMYTEKGKAPGSAELHITVAGLNKLKGAEYLSRDGIYAAFSKFTNNMEIPKEWSGRLTHTYVDDEVSGVVTDYQGNAYRFVSPSSVHMEEAEYHMTLSEEYMDLLNTRFNIMGRRYKKF